MESILRKNLKWEKPGYGEEFVMRKNRESEVISITENKRTVKTAGVGKAGFIPDFLREAARRFGGECLDLLFPRICPLCGTIVTKEEGLICRNCVPKAERLFLREPLCKKCGKQLESEIQEYCFDCTAHPKLFSQGVSLFAYRDEAKESMMGFKYHNKREYADYYAGQLMDRYGDRLRQAGAQAVIPVPLHAKKLRDRGYNQAEVLARRLGASLELPVYPKGLIRVQDTAPQKTLQGSQRGKNLYHAFRAGKLPKGLASVILVDDIYTTGATMNACSEALKKAGVRRIFCVSVCSGRN